jgi:hypothetical protein
MIRKNSWYTVDSFLLPQNETKFNEIHKSFSQFSPKFKNITEKIKKTLLAEEISWLFFEHLETQKMFAQNVDERSKWGRTALQCASGLNEVEIVSALIEASVDINAKDELGWAALHRAANLGHMEIAKILMDAGADLTIKTTYGNKTALQLSKRSKRAIFAEMVHKLMKN